MRINEMYVNMYDKITYRVFYPDIDEAKVGGPWGGGYSHKLRCAYAKTAKAWFLSPPILLTCAVCTVCLYASLSVCLSGLDQKSD